MLTQLTPPIVWPVTLDQLKSYLKIDHEDEDSYLSVLLQGACDSIQNHVGRSLCTQTWRKHVSPLRGSPQGIYPRPFLPFFISLPYPPLRRVLSVSAMGSERTIDFSEKTTGHLSGIVIHHPLVDIQVTYEAGYGDSPESVPSDLRQAILSWAGALYQYRHSPCTEVPSDVLFLLRPYQFFRQV